MLAHVMLDWADRALSLFDTIVALWLGVIVVLHAGKRSPSTWIAAGGLLLCGLFFAGHTTIVGRPLVANDPELALVWRVIWLPFIVWPYLWFAVIAWYTGLVRRRPYRSWFIALSVVGGLLLLGPLVLPLVPDYATLIHTVSFHILTIDGVAVVVFYPLYALICESLAVGALQHSQAAAEFMRDHAHRQSLPWLSAASYVLLVIAALVGFVAIAVLQGAQTQHLAIDAPQTQDLLVACDAFVALLIAIVIIFVGEAVVSYEIFTGNALPQSRLAEQWRLIQILAAYFAILVGGSLALPIAPIAVLVLATVLVALMVAIVGWRAAREREHAMELLRPFVASQGLFEQVLGSATPALVDIDSPFVALCADVLHVQSAYLVALGPLAPLVGPPLCYPLGLTPPPPLTALTPRFQAPQTECVVLPVGSYGTAIGAVPLWSERGLIGVLLLGQKRNGQLFTQEEIAIARATGERLIDTQASAQIARRLMALQRERLVTSQIADRRARHELHDEILPRLHATLLLLSQSSAASSTRDEEAITLLSETHHQIAALLQSLPIATPATVVNLGLFGALHQLIEGDFDGAFDGVTWQVAPAVTSAADALTPVAVEVIFNAAREAMRNAAHYGRGDAPHRLLHLAVTAQWQDGLLLTIADDGVGVAAAQPSQSSGQGLALHSTMLAVIGGTLSVESSPDVGTRVVLTLPD